MGAVVPSPLVGVWLTFKTRPSPWIHGLPCWIWSLWVKWYEHM